MKDSGDEVYRESSWGVRGPLSIFFLASLGVIPFFVMKRSCVPWRHKGRARSSVARIEGPGRPECAWPALVG